MTKRRNDETTKRRNDETTKRRLGFAAILLFVGALTSCTVPNPNKRYRDGGVEAAVDAPGGGPAPVCAASQALRCDDTKLVSCNADGTAEISEPCPFGCSPTEKVCASKPGPVCTANQALRCEGNNLVRCNADGSGEASPQPCSLGCNATEKRCYDMEPSNGLRSFLAQTGNQGDLDLGESATINTDTGDVLVGGVPVGVRSEAFAQAGAPTIRVFIVRSLTAKDVVVTGTNAVAVVSGGAINIKGLFTASGYRNAGGVIIPGPGAFTDGACKGGRPTHTLRAGSGGGGFGSPGGSGGSGSSFFGTFFGGTGGSVTGNAWLIPLRGGCDGSERSGGGGAIQIVSGTRITITGIIAANGQTGWGGGSGGGILLEAPVVEVPAPGRVVANGAGGEGHGDATGTEESGGLDATQARGGDHSENAQIGTVLLGFGGKGGAGNSGATDGESVSLGNGTGIVWGGHGGGGYGRIRINTAPGGHSGGGIYSPTPTFGPVGTL